MTSGKINLFNYKTKMPQSEFEAFLSIINFWIINFSSIAATERIFHLFLDKKLEPKIKAVKKFAKNNFS
jgi:hypothetical protein